MTVRINYVIAIVIVIVNVIVIVIVRRKYVTD
jgi:hypothetical protein